MAPDLIRIVERWGLLGENNTRAARFAGWTGMSALLRSLQIRLPVAQARQGRTRRHVAAALLFELIRAELTGSRFTGF